MLSPYVLGGEMEQNKRIIRVLKEMRKFSEQDISKFFNPYMGNVYFHDGTFYCTNDIAVITLKPMKRMPNVNKDWLICDLGNDYFSLISDAKTIDMRADTFDRMIIDSMNDGKVSNVEYLPQTIQDCATIFKNTGIVLKTMQRKNILCMYGSCRDFELKAYIVGK